MLILEIGSSATALRWTGRNIQRADTVTLSAMPSTVAEEYGRAVTLSPGSIGPVSGPVAGPTIARMMLVLSIKIGERCPMKLTATVLRTCQPQAIAFKARLAFKLFTIVPVEHTIP